MDEQQVGRRQTLKYLGMLTGTVAGREFLAAWVPTAMAAEESKGHQHHPPSVVTDASQSAAGTDTVYSPLFFKPDEFKTVETLTELIIPSDDTPGAKEAQVARYIDFVVFAAAEFKPALQLEWKQGLELLDRLSREKHQRPFHQLAPNDQESLLYAMSLPERAAGASHPGFDLYRLAKGMTVEGFYASRVGLIDVLEYKGLSVLSEFPGCTHPEHHV
ncbi:MAG TPA: gluconate 2-dehydrogenase subunit 3 family protein [Terriglobia bacterium]|nr:gluconate 2-dehydrogenase subunit 3 family protein [Terriglobia bacterium]